MVPYRMTAILVSSSFLALLAGSFHPGLGGDESNDIVIAPAYTFSLGTINTNGVTCLAGIVEGKITLGGTMTAAYGRDYYSVQQRPPFIYMPYFPDTTGHPDRKTTSRTMLGIGAIGYYRLLTLRNFSLEPGLAAGFWRISDEGLGSFSEFFVPRVKIQYSIRPVGFFIEGAVQMSAYALTPQIHSGVLFRLYGDRMARWIDR